MFVSCVICTCTNLFACPSPHIQAFPNGGGGYFHCGGSEVFDLDGEMLDIPPPAARSSADFDSPMLGDCSFGPGYRHPTSQHERQRSQQGYVVGYQRHGNTECHNFV